MNEQTDSPSAEPDPSGSDSTEPVAQSPETASGSEATEVGASQDAPPAAPEPVAAERATSAEPVPTAPATETDEATQPGTDEQPASEAPAPAPAPKQPPDGHWWRGTGRRKTAVARVRLRPGDGRFIVNKRPYDKYFTEDRDRKDLMSVLQKTNTAGGLDVHVTVCGGGYTGQAGAIVLGLGRAICKYDDTLEPILRENGFLTRDPRKVERKKYGQPGARRRFQFSKR